MQQASTAGAFDDRSLNRRVRRSKKTLVASSDNSGTRRGVPPLTHCEANILVSPMQPGVVVAGELVLGRRPAGLVQLRISYVGSAASADGAESKELTRSATTWPQAGVLEQVAKPPLAEMSTPLG